MASQALPRYADTVVIGGGTSGAALAGRLAAGSDRSVLLLEAGPDYGSFAAGGWPAELLDGRCIPQGSHSWNYTSSARYGLHELPLERARVIGGCSSHNGCAAMWGHRLDYDGWAARGNPGWGADDLLPLFQAANRQLRVRARTRTEAGPFHEAALLAAVAYGMPLTDDLNDLDEAEGVSVAPVNVYEGIRWNAAIAYLDPVRDKGNLEVRGNLLADRLLLDGSRVAGVEVVGPDGRQRVEAVQVVVSSGAYGSPALLLRSGIGAPEALRAVGIEPLHALPGVGENLHDHSALLVTYAGTPALISMLETFIDSTTLREEGVIGKLRSRYCKEAFDLHFYPVASPYWNMLQATNGVFDYSQAGWAHGLTDWLIALPVANMAPLSRGRLTLANRDPETPPILDHGYLTDPEDRDLAVLLDGVEQARDIGTRAPLADLLGPETGPGPEQMSHPELRAYIQANSVHYYHPVATCSMGPASDPMAVVDARGRVHGLDGLRVADASIMPVVPRANTNLPAAVVGEKMAVLMLEDERGRS